MDLGSAPRRFAPCFARDDEVWRSWGVIPLRMEVYHRGGDRRCSRPFRLGAVSLADFFQQTRLRWKDLTLQGR